MKSITIPAGKKKKAFEYFQEKRDLDWDVCLVHPENLVGTTKHSVESDLCKALKSFTFDMIIIDEFHQYKNLTTKRTKAVMNILSETRDRFGNWPRAVCMTGTPVSESPSNSYTFLKSIGFQMLPASGTFENYFTVKKQSSVHVKRKNKFGKIKVVEQKFKKVVGYKNLGELKSMIERRSIRRTKEDLKGFPEKIMKVHDVFLTGEQKKIYDYIKGELVAELKKSTIKNLASYLSSNATAIRLRQVLNSPQVLGESADSNKYIELDGIIEEVLSEKDQKILVWTEYRAAVDLLYNRYNKEYGAVKIYGGVEDKELRKIAEEFEGKEGPRVAVCIPAKAGTGVDFLARARTAVYVERPYSYTLYKQSLDRIHRRVKIEGELSWLDKIKSQPATLIFLDAVDTLDEFISARLRRKEEIVDSIMISNKKLKDLGREDLLRFLK